MAAATLPSLHLLDAGTVKQPLPRMPAASLIFPSSPGHVHCSANKRSYPLAAMAASASTPPGVTEYLEATFGEREGISFSGVGDSCAVRLTLNNGCSANLVLPGGLITSFKAPMWHGGTIELLRISVSVSDAAEDENDDGSGDGVSIRGGLSPEVTCENEEGVSWSPDSWNLQHIRGNPRDSFRLEMVSSSGSDYGVDVRNILTLGRDFITSEIAISNSGEGSSSLRVTGSMVCHLAVSTPDATYAIGLEGSDFLVRPPYLSSFSLIPGDSAKLKGEDSGGFSALTKLFPNWGSRKPNDGDVKTTAKGTAAMEEEEEDAEELQSAQEEDDNYKHLSQKLSRIYHNAPRNITIMDRGTRNSVNLIREGFEELYLMSPGSSHEWYGKDAYICVGHAAIVEPVILKARSQWKGVMTIFNPNT